MSKPSKVSWMSMKSSNLAETHDSTQPSKWTEQFHARPKVGGITGITGIALHNVNVRLKARLSLACHGVSASPLPK